MPVFAVNASMVGCLLALPPATSMYAGQFDQLTDLS